MFVLILLTQAAFCYQLTDLLINKYRPSFVTTESIFDTYSCTSGDGNSFAGTNEGGMEVLRGRGGSGTGSGQMVTEIISAGAGGDGCNFIPVQGSTCHKRSRVGE